MPTLQDLQYFQAMPLSMKVDLTRNRIRDWVREYGEDGCYISFSGGKDSTVLLDIVRNVCGYKRIPAVFVDVPTQFPELREFVKTFDNVEIIKPKISFVEVCEKYGFPLISKEVSECVEGARKYLTSLMNDNTILKTDRQTDRQTDSTAIITSELLEQEHIRNIKTGKHHPYQFETSKILGTCRLFSKSKKIEKGGTTTSIVKSEELANIPDKESGVISEEQLAELLNERIKNKTGGNNQRLAIMLGMFTNDKENPIKANVSEKDKSMFSQEKYKFFLDAPFEISNKCCTVMKKEPAHRYMKETGRVPMTAQMASESRLRTHKWLQNGCNAFDCKNPISNPMSFWTEQDILLYIKLHNLPICSVYGDVVVDYDKADIIEGQMDISDFLDDGKELFDKDNLPLKTTGCSRTGCCLCAFGANCEKREDGRFLLLKQTHPKIYDLLDICKNNGVTYREAIEWTNKHLPKNRQIWL